MRRRNQKIGIVSYSSRKEEETLINKKRPSSNHKWEGRASAKKGAWRSFILPIRQIIAQTSRSVGPGNGTSTRIKQGRTLGGVLSSSGSSMGANAASSPSTVMGSGLHQQLPELYPIETIVIEFKRRRQDGPRPVHASRGRARVRCQR